MTPDTERELIIIGDRVLILPDVGDKTESGLYLPAGLKEKEKVQTGYVVKIGPGYVVPHADENEPWTGEQQTEPQYIPLQVNEGDYAIFVKNHSIDIEYNKKKYLIIPQSGILAVVREKFTDPELL